MNDSNFRCLNCLFSLGLLLPKSKTLSTSLVSRDREGLRRDCYLPHVGRRLMSGPLGVRRPPDSSLGSW